MKSEIIESKNQITELRLKIHENAKKTYSRIIHDMKADSPIELFADIKFNKFGLDPIKGTPLNFIEQLNQMFSDLVVLYAVENLLDKYPDKKFEVNFGAQAGIDIQSADETVAAECFAVTSVDSNAKLREDANKLMKLSKNVNYYIFFYSQIDSEEKLERKYLSFPESTFVRIQKLHF